MSAVDEIMQQIPLAQLASQLGTDEPTASAAVQQALPALLGGLHANAQDPAGEASLVGALGTHSAGLIEGGVDLGQVDPADGQKIVGNIFGGHADGVAQTLGANLGGGDQSDLVRRLLPLLAPIVMSYLAKRMSGSAGVGGLLGSLLGGAAGGGAGNGGIGDLLGGMLGDGQQAPGAGGIGDLLGGLLGGGRR
ncbi:DUF937 domain-containing protein [uncultured Friedmanniella sp.]|uniref:DUF937 domain-containing protein n=1 Tax=uncultured Friedmanniella sp. TaxID=335381 RepID=UPI0035C9BF63